MKYFAYSLISDYFNPIQRCLRRASCHASIRCCPFSADSAFLVFFFFFLLLGLHSFCAIKFRLRVFFHLRIPIFSKFSSVFFSLLHFLCGSVWSNALFFCSWSVFHFLSLSISLRCLFFHFLAFVQE